MGTNRPSKRARDSRKVQRLAIFMRDRFRCQYCRVNLNDLPYDQRTLDHVIPQSLGGSSLAENLVACCGSCNSLRGNHLLSVWACDETLQRVYEQLAIDIVPFLIRAKNKINPGKPKKDH